MDKIKLNNQVILMRKYVKQAKVHCISKLVKESRLLQNRKGDEEKVLKAKRKAEKCLKEISVIQKIKPDSISKLALSKAKNWKEVLLMKNCPIEDRCVAMLANFKPVQREVEVFLNANKYLAPKVATLFKEWEEKSKLNKDSVKKKKPSLGNTNNKTTRIMQSKNIEEIRKDCNDTMNKSDSLNEDSENEASSTEKSQKNFQVENNNKLNINKSVVEEKKDQKSESVKMDTEQCEEIESESKPKILIINKDCGAENKCGSDSQLKLKKDPVMKETPEDESDFDMSENESENEDSDIDMEDDFQVFSTETKISAESSEDSLPPNKLEESDFKLPNSIKVDDAMGLKSGDSKVKAITMLNLDDLKDLEEIPVDDNRNNDESSEESETNKDSADEDSPNDPFFLRRDEAVSVENKLVDDPKSKQYRFVDKIFDRKEKSFDPPKFENKSQRPMNRSQKRELLRTNTLNKGNFSHKIDQKSKNWNKKGFEKDFKKSNFFQKNDQKSQNWNKNGFEKNNSKGRFQTHNQYRNEKDFRGKSVPNKKEYQNPKNNRNERNEMKNSPNKNYQRKELDSKPLHPSWEAKRKQKESINTSFQGKRMVFED